MVNLPKRVGASLLRRRRRLVESVPDIRDLNRCPMQEDGTFLWSGTSWNVIVWAPQRESLQMFGCEGSPGGRNVGGEVVFDLKYAEA